MMPVRLRAVGEGVAVIACNTCRRGSDAEGGARLVAALRDAKAADPRYDSIAVEEMPCMFACGDGCVVHLRALGKIAYVLGRFAATGKAAHAILDFAAAYAESACGEVPFDRWPEGVKGHFITRTPPPGFVIE